jgi:hypothetical protein
MNERRCKFTEGNANLAKGSAAENCSRVAECFQTSTRCGSAMNSSDKYQIMALDAENIKPRHADAFLVRTTYAPVR